MFRPLFLCAALLPTFALAGEPAAATPSKDGYTLFNPTPVARMREMACDRPDVTEGSVTVDAGHYQLELQTFAYATDHRLHRFDGGSTREYSTGSFSLKAGLTNRTDFELIFDGWASQRAKDRVTGETTRSRGFGDITLRLKVNFLGNDGGPVTTGMIPYVKLPLPSNAFRNGRTEGGLILPWSWEVSEGWSLSGMVQGFVARNDNGGTAPGLVNTLNLGRALTPKLNVYAELVSVVQRNASAAGQFLGSTGFVYSVGKNVKVDAGCLIGLNRAAPDFQVFTGISFRH